MDLSLFQMGKPMASFRKELGGGGGAGDTEPQPGGASECGQDRPGRWQWRTNDADQSQREMQGGGSAQ